MDQQDMLAPAQQGTELPVDQKTLVENAIDNVLAADDSLSFVDEQLKALDAQTAGEAFSALCSTYEALGRLFLGLKKIQSGSFLEARDILRLAAEGFNNIGQPELRDVTVGATMYTAALVEIQGGNIGRARELFTETRTYLSRAGKFGQIFEPQIDHMEPDNIYLQGIQALQDLDFDRARPLMEQASQAAEKVADTYYTEGSFAYNAFKGLGQFYKAHYKLAKAQNDFSQFQYDSLVAEIDFTAEAIAAKEFLSKADLTNLMLRNLYYMSSSLVDLTDVTSMLASTMQTILNGTFKPNPQAYDNLRQKIRRASDSAVQAGPTAARFTRFCSQLFNQVNNLEKLAKPPLAPVLTTGPSPQEEAARSYFQHTQEIIFGYLNEPLKQVSWWSTLTLVGVAASIALILGGAASALFWSTEVGTVTAVSGLLTTLISSVFYVQLRQTRREVATSRSLVVQQFQEASNRYFGEKPLSSPTTGASETRL